MSNAESKTHAPTALVSGSTRGIGLAIARTLVSSGYQVWISGRDAATLEDALTDLRRESASRKNGSSVHGFCGDLNDEAAQSTFVEQAAAKTGRIELCVASLGSGRFTNSWDRPLAEIQNIFSLNFFSAVGLTQKAVRFMSKGSSLVFISSIAGIENLGAPPAYAAAKSALLAYAKAIANPLAIQGIRVNCVSPGNVMFAGSTWDDKQKKDPEAVKKMLESQVPLNRFAKPEEVAEAVSYLASAQFVTGQNLVVDGGQVRSFL